MSHDIFVLTETWLQDDVYTSELFSTSFKVIRADRKYEATGRSRGGGVLLATRNEFEIIEIDLTNVISAAPAIDIIGVKILNQGTLLFKLYAVYIPPFVSFEVYVQFFEALATLDCINSDGHNVIIGDFNIPGYSSAFTDRHSTLLRDYESLLNLSQYNFITNSNNRTLDLVFSTLPCTVSRCLEELVSIDMHHPPLSISIPFEGIRPPQFSSHISQTVYNFKKANYQLLYKAISEIDWSQLSSIPNVDEACTYFYSALFHVIDKYVPTTVIKNKKSRSPPWITRKITKLIKKKQLAHRRYKSTNSDFHYRKFKFLRSLVKNEIRLSYSRYLVKTEDNLVANPKDFWSFVRQKKGNSSIPGILKDSSNNSFEDGTSIVNGFRDYFYNVFIKSNPTYASNDVTGAVSFDTVSLKTVNEVELIKAFRKLRPNNTSGIDEIPGFVVKDCQNVLIEPLIYLFNLIIETETFPRIWKTARICPIFKSGDKSSIDNYRPVSILNNFSKLFEFIIYDQIYYQVKKNLTPCQHGFIEKRSTVTNLTYFTQHASKSLDNRGQVDCIYLDISKAFDQIDIYLLLHKLKTMGFCDSLLNLLSSYLFNRENYVIIDFIKSNPFNPTSGVPQGSTLGPLLFLLFINDIVDNLSCEKLLYADDLKIFNDISCLDDCVNLQNNITKIQNWCVHNNLKINVKKSVILTYTRKQQFTTFEYHVHNIPLRRVSETKDLGVVFDSALTFNMHINEIVSASYKTLGFLFRTCKFFQHTITFKTLFYALIRSKLEYCSVVWFPFYNVNINRIESVQRLFLKYLSFMQTGVFPIRGVDYDILLSKFDFCSLQTRRLIINVKLLFDILNNKVDCAFLLGEISILTPRLNARQSLMFYCDTPSTNLLIKSPIYNICTTYNKYAVSCDVFFDNFNQIKRLLLLQLNNLT